ncbi:hypothetical protein SAMN05421847_1765 [Halpernia humi]|uniref:Uncharacterized protein n=1 Tax=Halpernia humi TaxID=493375 RepID=A0A1H5YDR9_9FLAO|nr:hypothetical protein [Halpernia humi]SEG21576.1 hypothetical protein SAMN05421847_1765 [Halpernia humi]
MTKNGFDIQTISIKRTVIQADRVLPFVLVTEKKEKADPSHFLKFLFADPHCTHLVLPYTQADPSQNQKSAIFANATDDNKITNTINLLKTNVQYIAPFHLIFVTLPH